ncbi:hypothetical protein HDF17_000309 [Granulicella arctica]|uniref:Uncharacterized protein n=1 Tax=Granulicella arctica TaxID=940613 RepID=A0A7Y9PDP2_9BACT|nr:hypothetical protein [Granulicella arctica]
MFGLYQIETLELPRGKVDNTMITISIFIAALLSALLNLITVS